MLQTREVERTDSGIYLPKAGILCSGRYNGTLYRNGKIIEEFEDPNIVTDEGLNNLLDVYFTGATQTLTWYLGLFESSSYTPVASTTAATVATVATETTAYSSTTRPEYVETPSSGKTLSNATSRASYLFTGTKNIYGAFLISSSLKSGTAGVLFSISKFASAKAVEASDELLLTYTFTAASV